MDKDQYHMQILKTLYLHEILLPWDLFIVKGSALKRAFIMVIEANDYVK